MHRVTVVIVEDSREFSDSLKRVLEEQTVFPCQIHVLNPSDKAREHPPTFEEFLDEIEELTESACFSLVLLDNDLGGKLRYKGANLAPSLHGVIGISSEEIPGVKHWFDCKASIAYHGDKTQEKVFLAVVVEALKSIMPPDMAAELPTI